MISIDYGSLIDGLLAARPRPADLLDAYSDDGVSDDGGRRRKREKRGEGERQRSREEEGGRYWLVEEEGGFGLVELGAVGFHEMDMIRECWGASILINYCCFNAKNVMRYVDVRRCSQYAQLGFTEWL